MERTRHLRCDLFKTLPREETRIIAIRDLRLDPDKPVEEHDVFHYDEEDCRRGRFGLGVHFLVKRDGTYETGRDVNLRGSFGKRYSHTAVAIGVVGGEREHRTEAQKRTIKDLIDLLTERYPGATVHDGLENNPASSI